LPAALATIVNAFASMPVGAQDPLLWGGLKPGPHAVGYRALYRLDHTRQYDPKFTIDPAQPPAHRPRPILTCVWYPTRKTSTTPIEYRQYLEVSSDDAQLVPFIDQWIAGYLADSRDAPARRGTEGSIAQRQ
jgi:hypothetical protein